MLKDIITNKLEERRNDLIGFTKEVFNYLSNDMELNKLPYLKFYNAYDNNFATTEIDVIKYNINSYNLLNLSIAKADIVAVLIHELFHVKQNKLRSNSTLIECEAEKETINYILNNYKELCKRFNIKFDKKELVRIYNLYKNEEVYFIESTDEDYYKEILSYIMCDIDDLNLINSHNNVYVFMDKSADYFILKRNNKYSVDISGFIYLILHLIENNYNIHYEIIESKINDEAYIEITTSNITQSFNVIDNSDIFKTYKGIFKEAKGYYFRFDTYLDQLN